MNFQEASPCLRSVQPTEACPGAEPGNAWLVLSAETTLGFGRGAFLSDALEMMPRTDDLIFMFHMGSESRPASVRIFDLIEAREQTRSLESALAVVCLAKMSFLISLGFEGTRPDDANGYHLAPELKSLIEAGLFNRLSSRASDVYRAAKGMELLCVTLALHSENGLVPLTGQGELSMLDSARVMAAKRLIAERFREKLTLEAIGRACGINRVKLTRGFREMFDCSVAETILEHRLTYASQLVALSDRPISSVGYDAGYLNSASFARAFNRRFGVAPTEFRARSRRRSGGITEMLAAS